MRTLRVHTTQIPGLYGLSVVEKLLSAAHVWAFTLPEASFPMATSA
jgi:hypothetical protein